MLTLSEMVNYEIPADFSMYMPGAKNITSGWNLPNFFPCSIINRNKSNHSVKPSYLDISREKQKKFLSISGKIKRNQRKSSSQSRPQIVLPSPKASKLNTHTKKSHNSFLCISTPRRNTVNIFQKLQTPSMKPIANVNLAIMLNKIKKKQPSDVLSLETNPLSK